MGINFIKIIGFCLLLTLVGCKEVTYVEQVPYQVEETYYVDEPYEVNVPVTKTQTVTVNKTRQVPILVDNSREELKELEFKDFSNDNNERTFPFPVPCWASFDIYNPNNVEVYANLHYIFDIWNYPQPIIDKEIVIKAKKTQTEKYSGSGNTLGCKFTDLRTVILAKGMVKIENRTENYEAQEEQEYTVSEKEIRTRKVSKTRTVTKYQERLVTEKNLLWK